MARITLSELIALMKEHPNYYNRWQLDVPAEQTLYIQLSPEKKTDLESEVFEIIGGSELVVDFDKDGKVYGIEIV